MTVARTQRPRRGRCDSYNCKSDHLCHVKPGKRTSVSMTLVGGGQPYLWVGNEQDEFVGYVEGASTLRRLAKAILSEVGDDST